MQNTQYKKLSKILLDFLKSQKLLTLIRNNTGLFYDEPKFYNFVAKLKDNIEEKEIKGTNYKRPIFEKHDLIGGGISFSSKYLALLKCLGEAIERYCLFQKVDKNLIHFNYFNKLKNALDVSIYKKNALQKKIGWIKGYNLTDRINSFVPAQLTYLNYNTEDEINLSTKISTGAAGDFNYHKAILRGIYEVIERDACMTSYLCRIKSPKINISSVKDPEIRRIFEQFSKYKLELHLFNITNDLEIPTFLSVLIDRTGLGPAVLVGTKSNLNVKKAIVGSIEEASMGRFLGRSILIKTKTKLITVEVDTKSMNDKLNRLHYWFPLKMISRLDYLINQKPRILDIYKYQRNPSEELNILIRQLKENGFKIYCVNITMDIFKKINYVVYKTIIPGMQPLYLDENNKELYKQRLKKVASHFNQKRFTINQIPHPFL